MDRFSSAVKIYKDFGVDVEKALDILKDVPVSVHCWQADDVLGFDSTGSLSGGIQTTGNYPGRARTPEEVMQDMEKAMSLVPGKKKINIHASYAVMNDQNRADRNALKPEHFKAWVDFAKKMNCGLDFNPTFFSHPMCKNGLTLTNPDETVRKFWIDHGKCCMKIAEYFAKETGVPCVINFWIGDGLKDVPGDRMGPRMRYKDSLEQILSVPYDKKLVKPCVESKVFGIGVESYTAGSAEFTLSFAAKNDILPLMDNGHYHPTEVVSDKIPALLCFFDEIALHITRPVRWDSDHVVLFDDETKEIAKEIVRNDALKRVYMALDYFDASINRVSALIVGQRSVQKALLNALLLPNEKLKTLQDEFKYTELMALQEEAKTLPFGDVWDEYLRRSGLKTGTEWLDEVKKYEKEVLLKRI